MGFKCIAVLLMLFQSLCSNEGRSLQVDFSSRYYASSVNSATISSCGGLNILWGSNTGNCWPCGETRGQKVTTDTAAKALLSISLPKFITVEFDLRLHGQMEFRLCPFKTPPGMNVPVPYCNRKKPIIIENTEYVKLKSFEPKEGEMSTPVVLNFDESDLCPQCILEVVYKEYRHHPKVLSCQGCGSQEQSLMCALILIDTQNVSRVRRQAENTNASRVSTESESNMTNLVDLNGSETFLLNQTLKKNADEQISNWTNDFNATSNEMPRISEKMFGNETLNATPSVSVDDSFNKVSSSNWTDDRRIRETISGNETLNTTQSVSGDASFNNVSSSNWTDDRRIRETISGNETLNTTHSVSGDASFNNVSSSNWTDDRRISETISGNETLNTTPNVSGDDSFNKVSSSNWTDDRRISETISGNETLNTTPNVSGDDSFNKVSSSNWTDDINFTSNETSAIMTQISISADDLKPKVIPYDPNILQRVDSIGGVPIDTRSNVSWYFPEVNVSIQSSIIKAFFKSGNMSLSDYNSSIAAVRFEEFLQGLSVDWMQNLPNETDEFNISSNIVADLVPILSSWSRNFSGSLNVSDGWSVYVVTDTTTLSHPVNTDGIAAFEETLKNAESKVPSDVEKVVLDRDIRFDGSKILKSDISLDNGGTKGAGHIVSLDMASSDQITVNNSMEGSSSNAGLITDSLKNNGSDISTNNYSSDVGSDMKNVAFILYDNFTLGYSLENAGINENISSDNIEYVTTYNSSNTVTENSTTSLHIFEFNSTANINVDHSFSKDKDLDINTSATAREVTKGRGPVDSVSSGLNQGSISLFESFPTIRMDSMLDTGFSSGISVGTSNAVYISDSNTSVNPNMLKPKSGSLDGKLEIVDDHVMIQKTTESNLSNTQTTKFISTTEKTVKMRNNDQTLGGKPTETMFETDKKRYIPTFITDSSSLSGKAHTNADSTNMLSITDSGRSMIRKDDIKTGNQPQQNNILNVNISTERRNIFPRINNLTLLANRSINHILSSNLSQSHDVKHNIDALIPIGQGLDGVLFDSSLKKPQDPRDVRFNVVPGSVTLGEGHLRDRSRSTNDINIAQMNQDGDITEGETNNVYNVWLHEARRNSKNRGQGRDMKEMLSEFVVDRQVDVTNLGGAAGTTDIKEWQMGDLTGSDKHWLMNDTTGVLNDLSLLELGITELTKPDSLGQFHYIPFDANQVFTTGTKSRDTMIGTTQLPVSLTPDPISVKVCPHSKRLVCEPFGNNKNIPGMKWWCYSNCKDGICPADKCKCLCKIRTDIVPTIKKAGVSSIIIQEASNNMTKDNLLWLHGLSTDNSFHQIKNQSNFNTKSVHTANAPSAVNVDVDLRMSSRNIGNGGADMAKKAAAEGHPMHSSTVREANSMWPRTTPAVTSRTRVSGTQEQDETGWLAAMTGGIQGMSDIHGQINESWPRSKPVFEGDIQISSNKRQDNVLWLSSNSDIVSTGTQTQLNTPWPNSISGGITESSVQDQSNMWIDSPGVVEANGLTSGAADSIGMSKSGAQEKVRLSDLKRVANESADMPGIQDKVNINMVVNDVSGINTPFLGWQSAIHTNTIAENRAPYTVLKCVGAGAFRDVVAIPEWCETVCPSGLCPETLCDCTIL